MERVITTTVASDDSGGRLDTWLSARFNYHTRNQWQKIIESGQIQVNGRTCARSKKIKAGDMVSFTPVAEEPGVDPTFKIVHKEKSFMIVDKSGNLPCHPAGPFFENTLWRLMQTDGRTEKDIFMVNRLDRETSGLVIVANDSETAGVFTKMLVSDKIEKSYVALVFGKFTTHIHARGFLTSDERSLVRKKRKFVQTDTPPTTSSEFSETHIWPISYDEGADISVVGCAPKTGRLHQIRATLYSLGFPLVGDKLYGLDDTIYLRFIEDRMTEEDRRMLIMPRQALHAIALKFPHPHKDCDCAFEIPLPEDILSTIKFTS